MGSDEAVHAFHDDALGVHDAAGLAELIASGELSATEAVDAAIARAEVVNPEINAFAHTDFDGARQRARAFTGDGAFGGVPTVIKDNSHVRGLPTRHGSRATTGHRATAHSVFVEQFLAMGPIPLGKSTLPEFGLTATTESAATGPTRNPWNRGYSTGGSSGGSAALVAAGVVPIAHGNDGGGSIRIPAACCGLVGLKASRGRILDEPEYDRMPVNIVCQGVLSRTVRDTALYLHAAEQRYLAPTLEPIGLSTGPTSQRLRIGYFTDTPHGSPSDPEVVTAVENTAQLCAEMGHEVEQIANPATVAMAEDFLLYWGLMAQVVAIAGTQALGQKVERKAVEPFTKDLARYFRRRTHRAPGALRRLRRFARDHEQLFGDHDVLLCPTLARPPLPIGVLGPEVAGDDAIEVLFDYAAFTPVQNVSGAPGISLPLGRSAEGLPIGVHLGAPQGKERRLLNLAFALEEAAPFARVDQISPASTL